MAACLPVLASDFETKCGQHKRETGLSADFCSGGLTSGGVCAIISRLTFAGASSCGCSSMVESQPSKLVAWVRFPSPAPASGQSPFRTGHPAGIPCSIPLPLLSPQSLKGGFAGAPFGQSPFRTGYPAGIPCSIPLPLLSPQSLKDSFAGAPFGRSLSGSVLLPLVLF